MTPGDNDLQENIRKVLLCDLKKTACNFQKLKGGRNSRVFRVECDDGSVFASKVYFQSAQDLRDRLGCEFRALQLLKNEGVREVAAPLAMDSTLRVAIYEFVAGRAPRAEDISDADIDQSVEFLSTLKRIANLGRAAHSPAASEACFSIDVILQNIDDRFRRLDEASVDKPELADFIRDELTPFRKLAGQWCHTFCREHDIAPDAEISITERTLSPSDFGFHNALRCKDGHLVFFDFEYFGWDDPAKMIADFLLHPAMEVPRALKQRFFTRIIAAFSDVPKLQSRVRAVYPLFGLKWCTILLNEFTLVHLARRRFASNAQGDWSETVQLEKARRMLAQITNDHQDFPYFA